MIIHWSRAASTAAMNAIKALFDAGSTGATLAFYTGAMPTATLPYTGPETAITSQTLLGTVTLQKPSGSVTTGTFTLFAITQDDAADNNGVATWARLSDSNGTAILDGDVTVTGGGGMIQVVNTTFVQGAPITVTSATFRLT